MLILIYRIILVLDNINRPKIVGNLVDKIDKVKVIVKIIVDIVVLEDIVVLVVVLVKFNRTNNLITFLI